MHKDAGGATSDSKEIAANSRRICRGMVLSGGGARGAYEAGVLSYIFGELPEALLRQGKIDVLCGTSIGAIHACFLASTAHQPRRDVDRLQTFWRTMRASNMLRLSPWHLSRLPASLASFFARGKKHRGLFLNVQALQNAVATGLDWSQIKRNLADGAVDALTVSTTHIASGRTTVFVDNPKMGGLPPWTRDKRRLAVAAQIDHRHALASAAIPVLFPAMCIDGAYYCDGGLRQNTPLTPALRLGANRVLVVALTPEPLATLQSALQEEIQGRSHTQEPYPGPFLLLGKILDALMLDHLDYDLARLLGFNRLLEDGTQAVGPDFEAQLQATSLATRGMAYRSVTPWVVRPSQDLGQLAARHIEENPSTYGRLGGWVLQRMADENLWGHSDLLSYIMFDGVFAGKLIELGRKDADARRDDLIAFFRD